MFPQEISHYRIIGKLGQGGMGEVYLAYDSVLRRKVAIKLLSSRLVEDAQAKKRLLREAQAAANLDHENICAIYEIGEEEGVSFIVMQYIEGESLSDRLRTKPPGLIESLDIVTQVSRALEEAHSKGVVHRDIKPQNIMITPRGAVKVLDFGLAKMVFPDEASLSEDTQSLLTDAGLIIGTAPYMSPEQAKSAAIDHRSDLFSLGAVLYECVTGTQAFTGSSPMEICGKVIHEDPFAASKVNPRVPPELDHLVLKLLAKKPNDRYQSATELFRDLGHVSDVLRRDNQTDAGPGKQGADRSRVSEFLHASSIVVRRPRVYIPVLMVGMVLPIFMALRMSSLWPEGLHKPSAEALRWYQTGTEHLRNGAYYQASLALEHATKADDRFALAYARSADAWTELDYSDKAKDALLRVATLVPNRSVLPKTDALYLEAVTDTVARDFEGAIKAYLEIARRVPDSEKAGASIELGRALEKNEDLKGAIEAYQKAVSLNNQYPAGFLRLGILLGRQQNLAGAETAFSEAEALYRDLGNYEGVTEVSFQRGLALSKQGNTQQAQDQLQRALDLTATTKNDYQRINAMLQLSALICIQGDTVRARASAREAIDAARSADMDNLTTQGLIDLGYAFLFRNNLADATVYLNEALGIAQRNKGRRNEARALLMLANLSMQKDDAEATIGYVEKALPFYEKGGYRKEESLAWSLLGQANDLKGDSSAALEAFRKQLDIAGQVNDASQMAVSEKGVGAAYARQDNYPEALKHFEKSCSLYQQLGYQLHIGYCLVGRADMLWRLGRYRESGELLSEAHAIASKPEAGFKQLVARIHLIAAESALSQRQIAEAENRAKQCAALEEPQTTLTAAEAKCTLGSALALRGAIREGKLACSQAVAIASRTGDPRLLATTRLALARVSLDGGDAETALKYATQALEDLSKNGQYESAWRAWLIKGQASRHLSDQTTSQDCLTQATTVLTSLRERWGDQAFAGYSTRADVRLDDQALKMLSLASR